ncbi:MAG: Fe-S cluster assembly protein SufD [Actinomycetota bacterium]|nr:Fe-S cluster assembly protein SufD [Actinomycetota bacterium]
MTEPTSLEQQAHEQSATLAAQVLSPESPANAAEDNFAAAGARPHSHGGPTGAAARPIPDTDRGERTRSFDPADFPVPVGREEDWRFTPLDRLGGLLDGDASDAHLDWSTELPEGVEVRTVEPGDPFLRSLPVPVDRVAALAQARSGGAVVISVPKEAEPGSPVTVRLTGKGDLVWGHVVIDVGAFARATVVLEHSGSGRLGAGVSVLVGDGAALELVSVQGWDAGAVHAAHYGIRLGRDARISSTQVTLGGDLVRIVETVEYAGPGGDAQLRGLYFADAGQHLEHRLFVDHAVPHCRSNVVYKGALQGADAHTVWIGDVLIRAEAEGTDTYELNRNLVLTDGARADSVPNLEIETGEITGAGHASATGRFDDEQLFYLMARGIPETEARRLVVRGFFAELLQHVGVPELRDRLLAGIDVELSRAAA